jgi:putative membrane protein
MHWMTDGQFWAMWIGMAVFWGSLLAFGIWLVIRLSRRPGGDEALRILRERFARGEIDEEEYRARSERFSLPGHSG